MKSRATASAGPANGSASGGSSGRTRRPAATGPNATERLGRTRAGPGSGYFGEIPPAAWEVLSYAWDGPFFISSNFARENPVAIAFVASLGWLSNISPDGLTFSRRWHLTAEGLHAMRSRAANHASDQS